MQLIDALLRGFRDAATDDDVWAVVLTGSGDAFCAGLDFTDPAVTGASRSNDDPVRHARIRVHISRW